MSTPPIPILAARSDRPAAAPAHGLPLLRLGFRPFYLGAAAFGALAVPLWVALRLGALDVPMTVSPLLWHAHEMLFGFAAAVIVGFLLTAGRAWTGLPTPRGATLGGLALLWLAARATAFTGPAALYMVLDMLLLPVVAGVLAVLLWRAGNRRNLPLPALLLLLAVANGAFHLGVRGWIDVSPMTPLHAGLAIIVMIECVMAGRVIPAFTLAATPGLLPRAAPWLETPVLAATALGLAAWVFASPGGGSAAALGVAAVLHAWRLWRWQPWATRGRPFLWILHAAYAWVPIGLGLLALGQLGVVPVSAGVHALSVGATGGLIIGMITRTARGHTGRPLQASPPEVAAYALVLAAALLRALAPLLGPDALPRDATLVAAAIAWSAAFAIYLWVFAPWLARTRLDGKDG